MRPNYNRDNKLFFVEKMNTSRRTYKGTTIVPGEVIGTTFLLQHEIKRNKGDTVPNCFDSLLLQVLVQLNKDIDAAGDTAMLLDILLVHRDIIQSHSLKECIEENINNGMSLNASLDTFFEELSYGITQNGQSDRLNDISDIYKRFTNALTGNSQTIIPSKKNVVVVSRELHLGEILEIGIVNIMGIILTGGSRTSHLAQVCHATNTPLIIQTDVEILNAYHPIQVKIGPDIITL